MRRIQKKWLAALAAVLSVPAVLVTSSATANGRTDPCLDIVDGDGAFEAATHTFTHNYETDDDALLLEQTTSHSYEVSWDRTSFSVSVELAAGCVSGASNPLAYRLNVSFPNGPRVSTTATSIDGRTVRFDIPLTEQVSALLDGEADEDDPAVSAGTATDVARLSVETLGSRGMTVDRAPDDGEIEICVGGMQSSDASQPCYLPDGGGGSYWN